MGREMLRDLYLKRRHTRDAMAYHMPKLKGLAAECQVCVEFGIRRPNSATALLSGNNLVQVHSYDLEIVPKYRPIVDQLLKAAGGRWHIHVPQNSITAEIPECDLLLHDSTHHYWQVMLELGMHEHKVRKYLVFHDTTSHGQHGQTLHNWGPKRTIKGIRPAIDKYIESHGWKKIYENKESQGLIVLKRPG